MKIKFHISFHLLFWMAVSWLYALGQIICAQETTTAPYQSSSSQNSDGALGIPRLSGNAGYGGPASVKAQLQEDRYSGPSYRLSELDDLIQPWTDFKDNLIKERRFQFGFDYSLLYQGASETLSGNDDAASGVFRMYGDWTLYGEDNKNTGSLIFKGENRSRYDTRVPPSQLGFEAGYQGITGLLYSDVDWIFSNLFWEQALLDGQAGFVIGRLEPDSYIDILGYANPWTTFQNLAVVVNPTIPFPDVWIWSCWRSGS